MNLKFKLKDLLIPLVRLICLVGMAYYIAQAIISGVSTLGAIIYRLFPVFAFGGILLILEIQKGNFAFLFSQPTLSDIKYLKKYFPIFIIILGVGVLLVFFSAIYSLVDLVMILLIIIAGGVSLILMFKGRGVDALCIFILAWPFMIFERSFGNVVFQWSRALDNLDIGIFSEDIAFYSYFLMLICSWLIRVTLNKEKIKSESWATGLLLLLMAGLISTIFSSNPHESWPYLINYYFLPFLFFILCINEINSWNDFKKLSLTLAVMMGLVTLAWLYYSLYRSYEAVTSLRELEELRGGGGRILGSRYPGYMGINYEYVAPMIIPIILALGYSTATTFKRNIWIGLAIIMIMTTFYTFGRNGYILLAICLLPWFLGSKRRHILFLLLIALLFTTYYFKEEIISSLLLRFSSFLSWQTLQNEVRVKIWMGSIQMFMDHPWSGIGIRMFDNHAADYGLFFFLKDEFGMRHFMVWANPHSMLFQIVSELGLPGLMAWCAMLWVPVKRLKKIFISPPPWSPEEKPWITAMKSNTLVIILLFFLGGFGNWGIEAIEICIFILLLAMIHIMDNLSPNKPLGNHIPQFRYKNFYGSARV